MDSKKQALLADLSLLFVAMAWGLGFIVIKNALNFMDPVYMLFLRFTVSTVIIGLLFIKKTLSIKKEDLKAGSVIGIFLFIAFLAQTVGLQYTEAGKQAFLTASNVVMVPFLLWLIIKKKPDKFDALAAIMAFIGIGLISLEGSFSLNKGDKLTLICAVFFALHIISVGHFSKKHDPIKLTIVQFGVAAILSLITCLILGLEFTPINMEITKAILFLSLVNTVFAFGVQNVAQKYTSSSHAAIILSLESVFGALASVLIMKEKMTMQILLGCLIMFLAVITAETKWEFLKTKYEE